MNKYRNIAFAVCVAAVIVCVVLLSVGHLSNTAMWCIAGAGIVALFGAAATVPYWYNRVAPALDFTPVEHVAGITVDESSN